MNPQARALSERLQAYLDGRLSDAQRVALERELAENAAARSELDALRRVSEAARRALAEPVPEGLLDRIRGTLDVEDRESDESRVDTTSGGVSRRFWLVAAAAVLGLALLTFVLRPSPEPLPSAVAQTMLDYERGRFALELVTADVAELERFFGRRGIRFSTRVLDLRMMQFELVGGTVHELAGRPTVAFAYSGPAGLQVLCQMYEGSLDELPPTADIRSHGGIEFRVFEVGRVKLAFWREGDLICVLASTGDLEGLVGLAFAKAMKV